MQTVLSNADYTFDASTKKITLAAPYNALDEERVLKIVNLTTRDVIYDHNRRTYPISISNGVITHTYDDTVMEDDDVLQIIVDVVDSVSNGLTCFDHEILTVTESVVGLTSATYLDAIRAEMTLETAQIRYWDDGSDPTSSEGHPVNVGDIITLDSAAQIANFKAIRTGSTSGKLMISYFH